MPETPRVLSAGCAGRILVAQLGARRHYAIPRILNDAGLLESFVTDLSSASGWPAALARWLPRKLGGRNLQRLLGRSAAGIPSGKIRSFPFFGISRSIRARFHKTPGSIRARHLRDNQRFGRMVTSAGFGSADGVYVFNGAGLEILQAAREQGLTTILEQTSCPVEFEEGMLAEERRRRPRWEGEGTPESIWRPMAEREKQEWALADRVLCGSEHVRSVLQRSGFGGRSTVVPYGLDPKAYSPAKRDRTHRPLRVLFVGNVRLLKGVGYLMEAAQQLGSDAEFRLVGPINLQQPGVDALSRHMKLLGPVPRSQVREHYDWADLFVFPSLSEGSANVCYEALACGLPVATTPNAGSVVRHGIEGWIFPPRDSSAIVQVVRQCLADPEMLLACSRAAVMRAAEFSWEAYARRLLSVLDSKN